MKIGDDVRLRRALYREIALRPAHAIEAQGFAAGIFFHDPLARRSNVDFRQALAAEHALGVRRRRRPSTDEVIDGIAFPVLLHKFRVAETSAQSCCATRNEMTLAIPRLVAAP